MAELTLEKINDFPLPSVSDEEYGKWKKGFDELKEHEKLSSIIQVTSQLFIGGEASLSVYKSMFACVTRFIDEADEQSFFSNE